MTHSLEAAQKTASLVELLPLQETLQEWITTYKEAGDIFEGAKREVKDRIEMELPETAMIDLAQAISRLQPDERVSRLQLLSELKTMVDGMVNETLNVTDQITPQDLVIIAGLVRDLRLMGTRSKRELTRMLEAIDAHDAAAMVFVYYPDKKKLDVRMTTVVAEESLLSTVGLGPLVRPGE